MLGTLYVQSAILEPSALYVGAIVGILSSTVLFINSFPDYDADMSKGRRTLVIILGRKTASSVFPIFIIATYAMIPQVFFLASPRSIL